MSVLCWVWCLTPSLQYYLTWLKDQLRMTGNEYVQSVAR